MQGTAPPASGLYVLRARFGGETHEAMFTVAGAPAADGTSVRFSAQVAGTEPLLVVSPAGGAAKPKNGRAEATFTVIGWGVGIIRIEARVVERRQRHLGGQRGPRARKGCSYTRSAHA